MSQQLQQHHPGLSPKYPCPEGSSGSHNVHGVGLHDVFEEVKQCTGAPSAKRGTALLRAQPVGLKHLITLLKATKIQEEKINWKIAKYVRRKACGRLPSSEITSDCN